MPYITRARAEQIANSKGVMLDDVTPGDLNYIITSYLVAYVQKKGLSYSNVSSAMAAANDAAEEMRRRLLNIYEDHKIYELNKNVDPYVRIVQDLKRGG